MQRNLDESHSDINAAFGPRLSVSTSRSDHLISSLLEIKNDLNTEVRTLAKRMAHIDEQIGQIYRFLTPLNQSQSLPRPPSLLLAHTTTIEDNSKTSIVSPPIELSKTQSNTITKSSSSSESDPTSSSTKSDLHNEHLPTDSTPTSPRGHLTRESSEQDSLILSIPPPPSVYNRSAAATVLNLGLSTLSRTTASNRIAPAATTTTMSPKQTSTVTFRPGSNTRFTSGCSPKSKMRSNVNRTPLKHAQSSEKSTIIDLESPSHVDDANKQLPLLTSSSSSTKSGSSIFRRFISGGNNEKSNVSSTLLYPPTSDDEHPTSPASSGNDDDDDDYRPLTSSSNKHHHTPL